MYLDCHRAGANHFDGVQSRDVGILAFLSSKGLAAIILKLQVPKLAVCEDWDSAHEVAWNWFWENIDSCLS